ncbi:nucleophile aminohydrolase [Ochromonadaceae sp. CCMP2298]|nr:nucleophile aminohydrolase [Ochromonadaceae sp. CCMP2298]
MSSTGSGYDNSCGTFSPDGRIFQVEYAQKAVENSGTAIGIKCSDGIVLAVGKVLLLDSPSTTAFLLVSPVFAL